MPGDSIPIALPLSRLASGASARAGQDDAGADSLYRELRKPLLRYLVCLGLSSDEAQDVVQDAFLSLHHHLAAGGSQLTNIVRAEPDPSLFTVPSEFRITEGPQKIVYRSNR